MSSSYTTRLRIEKPAVGEQENTWGGTANTSYDLLDAAFGSAAVTHDDTASYTLTTNNGATDEARCLIIVVTGTLTAARNLVVPNTGKLYLVYNNTTGGYALTVKTAAGTGISVANGKKKFVYSDGTNVVDVATTIGDEELEAIAGLTSAANKVPYFTGSGTAAVADFTSVGRAMVGSSTAASADNTVIRSDSTAGATQGSVATMTDAGNLTLAGTAATDWDIQGTGGALNLRLNRTDTHGDNVLVGTIEFRGRDSGGANQAYAFIDARAVLDNAGAETGGLEFRIGDAGTATQRLALRTGLYTPNATDGDKGADTINASALYDDGVLIYRRPYYAHYQNQQTSGTNGPTYTSGAWRTVTLNTEVYDADAIGSLSSNQVTLGAGSYEVWWSIGATRASYTSSGRSRLYNATDTSAVAQGINRSGLGSGVGGDDIGSSGFAFFTIAGSKAFELQYYTNVTTSTNTAVTTGEVEVYADMFIKKVA